MTPHFVDVLTGTAALIGLLFLYFGPFQWWIVDGARQMMFEARDDLFDLAAAGRISFDDDRYKTVRTGIESLIRFAHKASVFKVILLEPVVDRMLQKKPSEMADAIKRLGDDPQLQREVKAILRRAQVWMIGLIICRNPLTFLGAVFVLYAGMSAQRRERILGAFRRRVQRDARLDDHLTKELQFARHTLRAAA